MTIFGVPWAQLELTHVLAFFTDVDDEGLLWEAKGTRLDPRSVRKAVCGFANSHDGGYLILGVDEETAADGTKRWLVNGASVSGEPKTWVTNVVNDHTAGVRPRPSFDVRAWKTDGKDVVVVKIEPTSTPPCITNGTVYLRSPGATEPVRDPGLLADLYSRGDAAKKQAENRSLAAAVVMARDRLTTDLGAFRSEYIPRPADAQPEQENPDFVRFAVAVAATGNKPDISSRLFGPGLAESVSQQLGDPGDPFGPMVEPIMWSQDALMWRRLALAGPLKTVTVVRAAWDGCVVVGQKLHTDDARPDALIEVRMAPQWRLADALVDRLGGFGDVYVTVVVAGGRFPRREGAEPIVMQRGPVLPGVDPEHVASLSRELMRAVGNPSETEP